MEKFEVKFIIRKGGTTKVRYMVKPTDAEPEESIVSRADVLHEDFRKLWALLPGVARRMLEFPQLEKLFVSVEQLNRALEEVQQTGTPLNKYYKQALEV